MEASPRQVVDLTGLILPPRCGGWTDAEHTDLACAVCSEVILSSVRADVVLVDAPMFLELHASFCTQQAG